MTADILRCLCLIGITIGSILPGATAGQFDAIRHWVSADGRSEKWRIDRPNVQQPRTEYRSIRFRVGDAITIRAAGCVNTGGSGKTTKRYVDPLGADSERLYHGMIWIPGAIPDAGSGLVRIQGVLANRQMIPQGSVDSAEIYLRLGYEDDDYGDNCYCDWDEGNPTQCTGEAAWVELTIDHDAAPTPTPTQLPFDLQTTPVDANSIPLNPSWGWQVIHAGQIPDVRQICGNNTPNQPQYTSQAPSIDNAGFWHAGICAAGEGHSSIAHVNWGPGTYIGKITWEKHSNPIADDDYNMRLDTSGAGLVTTNDGTLVLEFDSGETIDHFDTPWWNMFHSAVDHSNEDAQTLINGKQAIVTGLVGMDCEHDCQVESHPVWALAIHVNDDSQDDTWAFFVRNWGNEGYCSQDQHYLDLTKGRYTFRLPGPPGAKKLEIDKTLTKVKSDFPQLKRPEITWDGSDVLVSFTLPPPELRGRIHGELHMRWIFASQHWLGTAITETTTERQQMAAGNLFNLRMSDILLDGGRAVRRKVFQRSDELTAQPKKTFVFESYPGEEEHVDAEDKIQALLDKLTPEQLYAVHKRFLDGPVLLDDVAQDPQAIAGLPPEKSSEIPKTRTGLDEVKEKRDALGLQLLREIFKGEIPGWKNK